MAPDYKLLLGARIVTGIFGGVISSIAFAIITDLFAYEIRGRVMGTVQTAFAASQVLGLPFALFLSNHWGWHSPFLLIVAVSTLVGILIWMRMKPVDGHLKIGHRQNPFKHLLNTVSRPRYLGGFAATALLSTGGFMMMPFGSAFNVNNLGVTLEQLPFIYLVTGTVSILTGPWIGRMSDRIGKFSIFVIGSSIMGITVLIYTRLHPVPIGLIILISTFMFSGVSARMISASALMSALPDPADRGSYMAVSSSLQQIAGGIAAAIGGMIVLQSSTGALERFDVLGNVVVGSMLVTVVMMSFINRSIAARIAQSG